MLWKITRVLILIILLLPSILFWVVWLMGMFQFFIMTSLFQAHNFGRTVTWILSKLEIAVLEFTVVLSHCFLQKLESKQSSVLEAKFSTDQVWLFWCYSCERTILWH